MARKFKPVARLDECVVMTKENPSRKDASSEKPICTRKDTFPLEIWHMTMEYMDLETLFTMSLVSTEMKALADEKMLKLKSKIEGKFVNINEVQENYYIGPPHLNRVMIMKTMNIAEDENNDLVCNIERAYIVRMKVVQRQQVASIKLCPVVQKLPEALNNTKMEQIMKVKFNMWISDENIIKLVMLWSESSKIKLVLKKANGSLVQTDQNGISEVMTTFTQVSDSWPHLVRDQIGLVARLDVTNIKLRASRRKVVEMKHLIPRLRDAILRLPPSSDVMALGRPFFLNGRLSPCQALEVGKVDLIVLLTRVLDAEFPVEEVGVDHHDMFEYIFERLPVGVGIVLNKGTEFFCVDRDDTVLVKYYVLNTFPSSACIVDSVEQIRLIESEEQFGNVENGD